MKLLKSKIQQHQKAELAKLFVQKTSTRKAKQDSGKGHPNTLVGLVDKRVSIYRTYKGKEYKATLNPKGVITLAGKQYTSPSGAAKAVLNTPRAVNGWKFWYIQDVQGDWVQLADFKG